MTIEQLDTAEDGMHSNDGSDAYIRGFKNNPVAEEEICLVRKELSQG